MFEHSISCPNDACSQFLPMGLIRTRILVSGFTEREARDGIPDLLSEFQKRPWIISPEACWSADRRGIIATTHYEGSDPDVCSRAALDEMWDCVIACITFSSDGIEFNVEESVLVVGNA